MSKPVKRHNREEYLQTPESLAVFANALRNFLGLAPLGKHDYRNEEENED